MSALLTHPGFTYSNYDSEEAPLLSTLYSTFTSIGKKIPKEVFLFEKPWKNIYYDNNNIYFPVETNEVKNRFEQSKDLNIENMVSYYDEVEQEKKKSWPQLAQQCFEGIRGFTEEEAEARKKGLAKLFKPTGRSLLDYYKK